MIFNCTKETKKKFKIPYEEEFNDDFKNIVSQKIIILEKDDLLLNWGLKYFIFDGRKCIQFVNFLTKFNIYAFDLRVNDKEYFGEIIAKYLLELYKDDKVVIKLLERLYDEHPLCIFSKLENKSIISTLNTNETLFAENGYRFYDYIENNVLNTMKINYEANWENLVTLNKKGKKEYILPAEEFKKELIDRYK